MSAPTHEKPATEQPTQPLPVAGNLPRGGSWLMSESSEALIPVTVLAAIGAGAVAREFLTVDGRFLLALLTLGGVLLVCVLVFLAPRLLMREDGQHSVVEREH